jgi:hypothetical protein
MENKRPIKQTETKEHKKRKKKHPGISSDYSGQPRKFLSSQLIALDQSDIQLHDVQKQVDHSVKS